MLQSHFFRMCDAAQTLKCAPVKETLRRRNPSPCLPIQAYPEAHILFLTPHSTNGSMCTLLPATEVPDKVCQRNYLTVANLLHERTQQHEEVRSWAPGFAQ